MFYGVGSKFYPIKPTTAPRMTQSDKWKTGARKRPCVRRYHAFRDEVRLRKVAVPLHSARITFHMPMPKSWSKKKRELMRHSGHQQAPDVDNLCKALLDAVYPDGDSHVWDIRLTKIWNDEGGIEVGVSPDIT